MDARTLRLVADVSVGPALRQATRWLRIVGDDERGYLMVGDLELEGAPGLDEFWFPSLDLALEAGERAGIPRGAWILDDSPPSRIAERAQRAEAICSGARRRRVGLPRRAPPSSG